MAFHQAIQRLLLLGVRLKSDAPLAPCPPPDRLRTLVASIEPERRTFDDRALHFGHRYRTGFWAIYLLSALAVLCAVLPLGLGWDNQTHAPYFAALFACCEVIVIGTVSTIYAIGLRRDWQGEWLRARTTAELAGYLPMVAPLIDFATLHAESNWYVRAFDPGQHLRTADEVSRLCERLEPSAQASLAGAWADATFVTSYAQWTINVLEQQRRYHCGVAARQHALLHRVHLINTVLFGLTACAALLHLVVHALWLSLITTFFPALGASLHGALAQSEAHRLASTSERLDRELGNCIEHIQARVSHPGSGDTVLLKASVEAALALILEEHQDWNLLVRPHRLPLA